MNLEDRLRQHLTSTGEELVAPPASADEPIARAGQRRRRRALGSSFAVIALVAGGFGVAQIADTGASQDIVAGAEDQDTETSTGANNEAADSDGENSEAATTEDTVAGSSAVVGAMELPESTGPTLQWTETAGAIDFYPGQVVWSGRAFIALANDESGSRVLETSDGSSWTPAGDLPTDADFWGMQSDGAGTLVVWGQDRFEADADFEVYDPPPSRLFVSTDGGSIWSERVIPTTAEPASDSAYLSTFRSLGGAAVSGNVLVIGITEHVELDLDRLLADKGIGSELAYGYSTGGGQISRCIDDRCETEETYTYEELELTDAESQALDFGLGSTTILRSVDGGPFEETGLESEGGFADAILTANGEFIVCMMDGEDGTQSLHASPNGTDWELRSSGQSNMGGLTSDGTSLFAQSWSDQGTSLVRSDDGGRTWNDVGFSHPGVHTLHGGPEGLVVTGQLFDGSFDEGGGWSEFPVTIEKDGVSITWAEDFMTVADVASGEVIYEFGPEEMDGEDAPAGIVETDDGFDVLDPETGELLVSMTQDDIENAFGIPGSDAFEAGTLEEGMMEEDVAAEYVEPESFIGWSANGETWGWQTTAEAFGSNGWAQLVVGDNIVLAVLERLPANGEEEIHEFLPEISLFVAEIN